MAGFVLDCAFTEQRKMAPRKHATLTDILPPRRPCCVFVGRHSCNLPSRGQAGPTVEGLECVWIWTQPHSVGLVRSHNSDPHASEGSRKKRWRITNSTLSRRP